MRSIRQLCNGQFFIFVFFSVCYSVFRFDIVAVYLIIIAAAYTLTIL